MMTPMIHLNGSDPEILMKGFRDAAEAVQKAMGALDDAQPNGRDYYPQGPDALREALHEHDARLDRLRTVRDEMTALMEHCQEALDARQERREARLARQEKACSALPSTHTWKRVDYPGGVPGRYCTRCGKEESLDRSVVDAIVPEKEA